MQHQPGLRHAYTKALPLIEGDILLTFSPDGNSIPELIPDVVNKIREGWDMVVVSRYLDGARSEDDDTVTGFGNWFFPLRLAFSLVSNIQMPWESSALIKSNWFLTLL